MIPKIIHYCWFGRGDKSAEIERCMATWRAVLPDYEIKEWNESNFPYKKYCFTREAYFIKKYAFVSDVCRLYALYAEGGIYLDTDIEVLKSFDQYLSHKSFVGYEVENLIGTGVIGAEKGTAWLKIVLDTYITNQEFIRIDGGLCNTANTIRITELFKGLHKEYLPVVYSLDYFCAKHWKTKELFVTDNTVCIHHYQNSWSNNPIWIDAKEQEFCDRFKMVNRHVLIRLYKKYIELISFL